MGQDQLVGRTIGGRFRIEALLGEGAMGRVYRARQTALGTYVALKVLHEELARMPAIEARFLREAQAASRIDHPSSVRVIDFGKEEDGLLYLAMELLEGRSLADILTESGPLPAVRIIEIASQVLAALAVAHELGVVHRDLKPENIMVVSSRDDDGNPRDVVKVCDFGIAKLVDGTGAAPTVTQEGMIVGTPAYMSPEQARGEALDGRSDIYAMGVLLFQMMTGEVPFDATSAFGTALMHVTDEPTKPRLLVPTIDARLEAICLKAMRKRPEERHASARELRSELRALLAHVDPSELAAVPSRALRREGDAGSIAPATLLAQVEPARGRGGRLVVATALAGAALVAAFLFGKGAPPPAPTGTQASVAAAAAPPPPKAEAPPAPTAEATAEPSAPEPASTSARAARRTDTASRSASRSATSGAKPSTASAPSPSPSPATPGASPKPKATVPVTARTPVAPAPPSEDDGLPTFIPRAAPEKPASAPAAPEKPAAPAIAPEKPAAPA